MAYTADKTIDGLDELTSLDSTDVLIAGDQSDLDRAKKITKANLQSDMTITASQVSDFDTEVSNNSSVVANTAKNTYPSADASKLSGIETGATADQTGAEIKTAYENEANTNAYTDAEKTKLAGVEASADVTDATNVASAGAVMNTGDETIAGVKTFSSSPVVPAPKTDLQAATKKYVDDNAGGAPEGTAVKSTGETGGTKFLREDGDGTSSWQAITGGGDALTANPLSQFAATTSAQLAGVMSDETGSGALVFGTSPNITTPTGIVKGDVGLGNVDNTSDATKNSATATLTNKTIDTANNTITVVAADVSDFDTEVANNSAVTANTAKTGVTTEISNVVEDTTPQLGGELDSQAHSIGFTMQTATGSGATTVDWGAGNHMDFTFGAFNETFTFTAPSKPGVYTMSLKQDSVGSRTATWPATVKWAGGTAPTLTTTATTGYDLISFRYDGTNYYAVSSLDFS